MPVKTSARPRPPLRLGLLGTGSHCRREHLPALRAYCRQHPSAVTLQAVCDLDEAAAREVAGDLGFAAVYTDMDAMLARENLDAVIAVTPVAATAAVAKRIMREGIPLLMEKPLGTSLAEARSVVETYDRKKCPVMVGLNRRFDPVLVEASAWVHGRDIRSFLVRLHRVDRTEKGFIADVLPHPLDFLSSVLGPLSLESLFPHGGGMGASFSCVLRAGSTVSGILECLPHTAAWRERYAFSGPGFHVEADSLCRCEAKAAGEEAFHYERPPGVEGGTTYGETRAFLEGVRTGNLGGPDPAEVLHSMEVARSIEERLYGSHPSTA